MLRLRNLALAMLVISGLFCNPSSVRAQADGQERGQIPTGPLRIAGTVVNAWPRRHHQDQAEFVGAGGIGNPYFSTDTAAALRAMEIKAEIILKGTKVDGIYDADPLKHPRAKRFDVLTYFEVLQKGLRVMDTTAISLCMENRLPIIVYDLKQKGNLRRIVMGEKIGTMVKE